MEIKNVKTENYGMVDVIVLRGDKDYAEFNVRLRADYDVYDEVYLLKDMEDNDVREVVGGKIGSMYVLEELSYVEKYNRLNKLVEGMIKYYE